MSLRAAVLGHVPPGAEVRAIVASPVGTRIAAVVEVASKYVVVENETIGPSYDSVRNVVFSPDGTRLAYVARQGQQWFVVDNGSVGSAFGSIAGAWQLPGVEAPVFSPDGHHLAYFAATRTDETFPNAVVVDGHVIDRSTEPGEQRFAAVQGEYVLYGDARWQCASIRAR